jgi:hypothetical protein
MYLLAELSHPKSLTVVYALFPNTPALTLTSPFYRLPAYCYSYNLLSHILHLQKKRRAEVHALLLSESRKEAKEKSLIAQQNIRKKAEQDRLDKMSISERRKYEAKQKDKEMRKLAMKQQKK